MSLISGTWPFTGVTAEWENASSLDSSISLRFCELGVAESFSASSRSISYHSSSLSLSSSPCSSFSSSSILGFISLLSPTITNPDDSDFLAELCNEKSLGSPTIVKLVVDSFLDGVFTSLVSFSILSTSPCSSG